MCKVRLTPLKGAGWPCLWVVAFWVGDRRKKRYNLVLCACSLVERIVLKCCYVLCVKHSNSCYVQLNHFYLHINFCLLFTLCEAYKVGFNFVFPPNNHNHDNIPSPNSCRFSHWQRPSLFYYGFLTSDFQASHSYRVWGFIVHSVAHLYNVC